MKLYGFPPSPNTRKVQAVAAHLGIPLELSFVDLSKGGARTPEFLAINPCARTPVLVDGDFTLWESNAIMQYIAGKSPNSLWPEGVRARADIARWQFWQTAHWRDGCSGLIWENVVKQFMGAGDTDPAAVKTAEEAFHRDAKVLDGHLARHSWLVNDALTLADFSVGAYLHFALPAKMPLAPYPAIRAWYARIEAVPAWKSTAPQA